LLAVNQCGLTLVLLVPTKSLQFTQTAITTKPKADMKFIVVLHTDDGERYGVTVPDLPGCFSGGDTFELALQNVEEAIDTHVETLIDDGQPIPLSLSLKQHQKNTNYKNGVWAIVNVSI
jgi:predicted RNase H-like HicB family nuclease